MVKTACLQDHQIIEGLKVNYGIEVMDLIPLSLGADTDASLYKVQSHHQLSYFLKLKRNIQADKSSFILTFLSQKGIQEVIPPVKTFQGNTTLHLNGISLTIFPFIDGCDGFRRDLTDCQWTAFGKLVKAIHEIAVPRSIQAKMRRESYSAEWRKIVRSFYPIIESNLNVDEISTKLYEFMQKHLMAIHRLVDRTEQLAQKAQEQLEEFVLCHSDLHGGNILLSENGRLYIVDWDNPIMAPKERDLMFIGGGVANIWNKPREKELFYQGYGGTEVNPILLAYYRHERILEDIAIYGQKLLLTTEGHQDRLKWYHEFVSQFEPRGVIDIAFKTDEELNGRFFI